MSTHAHLEAEKPSLATGLRPVVCVQGLGFVGTAMALAVASARDRSGRSCYDVIGVELPSAAGRSRADSLNAGRLPIDSVDDGMGRALEQARRTGNFVATTDMDAYALADVVTVSVHLDLRTDAQGNASVDFTGLRSAVRSLAERLREGSLIVVETTVPPGTSERVLAPEIAEAVEGRGMAPGSVMLAYSYERVMPGPDYLDSVSNFWRVYAGQTPEAAAACEAFLSRVVDVGRFPLSQVESMTAAETGKLLENSYRATTIAFMEEWGRFAEAVGMDLYEVIDAVRVRPTHSNMRQPGFGVGGYCLTKDPLFAGLGARELFGLAKQDFSFSERAVEVNNRMPLVTVGALERLLDGSLAGKRVLLLGASYRQGVDDTRFSPSLSFLAAAGERGAQLTCHDPYVSDWQAGAALTRELPDPGGFDAVVFAVAHDEYLELDVWGWLGDARPVVLDANRVLGKGELRELAAGGCTVWAIGRGEVSA